MKFKMIVRTETAEKSTEYTRYVPQHELQARRESARLSAPLGSTRTVRVTGA